MHLFTLPDSCRLTGCGGLWARQSIGQSQVEDFAWFGGFRVPEATNSVSRRIATPRGQGYAWVLETRGASLHGAATALLNPALDTTLPIQRRERRQSVRTCPGHQPGDEETF